MAEFSRSDSSKSSPETQAETIVITGGDPAGIGPEMVSAMLPELRDSKLPILYLYTGGPREQERLLDSGKEQGITIRTVSPINLSYFILEPGISLVPVEPDGDEIEPGNPSAESGRRALEALRLACAFIEEKGCRGLLTAPISKEWIARSGPGDFRGHTDYLADFFNCPVMMLMHGDEFSVIPLTIHIPLADVPAALERVLSGHELPTLLKRLRGVKAYADTRWAFCGLNPHAGEGGLLGREDRDFIGAWLARWASDEPRIDGPVPADAVFQAENRKEYRLILGCYHDQVLIPFKALEGRRGVNCTIGLPFPRTSPDHGTAFEIAGSGQADATSMRRAFRLLVEGALNI